MFRKEFLARLSILLAIVFLILTLTETAMLFVNRNLQTEVNQRRNYITQTGRLSQLNQALVKAMAVSSIKDENIRQILSNAGYKITYKQNQPESKLKRPSRERQSNLL